MARTRNLKPAFFDNELLGECDPLARLLFQGMWCQADRDGCLEDRPLRLKKQILPWDDCSVVQLLDQLAQRGFIERFTSNDGRAAICIIKFLEHQSPHENEKSTGLRATKKSGKSRNRSGKGANGSGKSQNRSAPYMGSGFPSVGCEDLGSEFPCVGSGNEVSNETSCRAAPDGDAGKTPASDRSDEVRQVFGHYRTKHPKAHPKPLSGSKEWRAIRARLAEGYTASDLCEAIDGNHLDPFHCGENDRGKEYHSLELICRTSGHVAKFIEVARAPPKPVLSEKNQRNLRAASEVLDSLYPEGFADGQAASIAICGANHGVGDDVPS
jgi:hypothetical protein